MERREMKMGMMGDRRYCVVEATKQFPLVLQQVSFVKKNLSRLAEECKWLGSDEDWEVLGVEVISEPDKPLVIEGTPHEFLSSPLEGDDDDDDADLGL